METSLRSHDNEPQSALRMARTWDAGALEEVFRTDEVWAVLVTDGHGRTLEQLAREKPPDRIGEIIDLGLRVVHQMGRRIGGGDLQVVTQVYDSVHVVSARSLQGHFVSALATDKVDLLQLSNAIRRVFAQLSGAKDE